MCGSATLVTVTSSTCMTVTSITAPVIVHFSVAESSPSETRPADARRLTRGGSVHAPRAAGPVGLAQLELLELAGRRAVERLAQLDRRRALVVRHAAAAMLDQLALGGGGARAQDDERLDGLAPLLVRHADHRDLGHGGMLEKAVRDLDRRDVLPDGDDHVHLADAKDDGCDVCIDTLADGYHD